MQPIPLPPEALEVREIVDQWFVVEDFQMEETRLIFYVRPRMGIEWDFSRVKDRLARAGYLPVLRSRAGRLVLHVLRRPPVKPERVTWNLVLLLATVGTTLFVGFQMSLPLTNIGLMPNPWQGAALFSAGIVGVLGCHELGHKLMANRRGVRASYPYFIPVPYFLGTFGAVIKQKEPAPGRNALFDVAASGPIAGFLVMLPVTIVGILLSYVIPVELVPEETIGLPIPMLLRLIQESILPIPEGHVLLFHPLAFVGWVGMVVTMLNLMPVGMLDGGHISRALFGEGPHRVISFAGVVITFMLGFWPMAVLMLLFAMQPHPGPLNDVTSLSSKRRVLSLILVILFILCIPPTFGRLF
jgi:membrane-associated protease RseP (regulator of RpoE activity)